MEWAVWVGTAIFVGTVAGLLWMRNRPVLNAQGQPVDEFGRPTKSIDRYVKQIINVLVNSGNTPMSAYELRCKINLSRNTFYAALDKLVNTELVERNLAPAYTATAPRFYHYRLTDNGFTQATMSGKSQRGRHRG